MKRRLSNISIIMVLLGLVFLAVLYFQRDSVLRENYYKQFNSDAKEIATAIIASKHLRQEVLSTISKFFSSSLNVNKWEFHNFTNGMLGDLNVTSICYFGEDGIVFRTLKNRRDNCGKYAQEGSSGYDADSNNMFLFQDVRTVDGTRGRALMVFQFDTLIPRNLIDGGLGNLEIKLSNESVTPKEEHLFYHHDEAFIVDGKVEYFIDISRPMSYTSLTFSFDHFLIIALFAVLFTLIIYNIESGIRREYLISKKVKEQKKAIEKQYEEIATQKRIAHQNEKLASIGVLAAGIGHEINNPLSIIKGQLEKLKSLVTGKDEISDRVNKVNNSARRIERIVSSLRKFSRQSKDDSDDGEKLINISALFIDTVTMLKELYEKDGVKLGLYLSLKEDLFIRGDRGKFQQVLINLISNAKDAVEGRKNAQIKVVVKSQGDKVDITVLDNGIGISKNDQAKIFDLFYTTKDVGRGTGIGLSLTREFVQDVFHGQISVRSELGKGTSFHVTVPAIKNIVAHDNQENVEVNVENLKCVNCRALVVDDEEGIRELLQEILIDLGVDTKVAEDGKVALDMYLKNPSEFDVIISDLKMPNMNGPELFRQIRSHKNLAQPKIILTSGCVNLDFEDEDRDKDVYDNVNGFIYKPFSEQDLVKKINEVMSKEEVKRAA